MTLPTLLPGEVAILRTCNADGTSHGGFRWPLEPGALVEAPDWSSAATCGKGLHGLARGEGEGLLLNWDPGARWFVVAASAAEMVDLAGKVKFPRCRVLHVGDRSTAPAILSALYPGAVVVAGTATAGDGGTATAGDRGTATAGHRGTVIVRWHDGIRYRLAVGYVGEDGIEPNTPYVVRNGKLVRK